MYLSTSLFDNAVLVRGSFQALRVTYRHTHGVRLLWKKKDTSFLRLHPAINCKSMVRPFVFGTTIAGYHLTTPTTTYLNRTPTSTGLPPQPDNNQANDNNPETFNTPPSSPHPPDVPMPDDPHTPNPGFPPDDDDDDPFHKPFQLPPRPNDDSPDEEMQSPPDLPPYPSPPPDYPQPLFPGAQSIPVAPDTVIVPNTVIPPNIDDTPMTHSTKRPPDDPPIPPATEARPSQMPASSSSQFHPSNHLGGDTQPSVTHNATTQPALVAPSVFKAKKSPKNPKDVAVPDDFDDDEPDPDAGPSGQNGLPLLPPRRDAEMNLSILHLCLRMIRNRTLKINKNRKKEEEEEEEEKEIEKEEPEEDTDDTIPFGSTDTDETLDYNDLVIDDSQWCLWSQEQKVYNNTASFSVPIDCLMVHQ